LFFHQALLPGGWSGNVLIEVDGKGWITGLETDAAPDAAEHIGKCAIPGLPNVHSHAFQRAMAGLTEVRGDGEDDFWTWRQAMYRFVERLTPRDLGAIAAQLYAEMLEAGFTSVAEFHYLHHDTGGAPYDNLAAMAEAIAEAAGETGIGVTYLPVFYAQGNFGGAPAAPAQSRFVNTPERYAALLERVRRMAKPLPDAAVGIAAHSLRAVTPESLREVLTLAEAAPVHIHIAEQAKEVDDCIAWCGRRPVEWLLDNAAVDERWCLVHATHMSADEIQRLARSGAVAGLCPITEANLGDGIFDAVGFVGQGGRIAVGSDSNVYVSAAEEIRSLEYSQRLRDRGRNRLAGGAGSTGRALFDAVLSGGAQASGRKIGRLSVGYRADIVSLDDSHPALVARDGDAWLDGWVFAGDNSAVSDVWVGGRHVVAGGRHRARDTIAATYRQTLAGILGL